MTQDIRIRSRVSRHDDVFRVVRVILSALRSQYVRSATCMHVSIILDLRQALSKEANPPC